MWDFLTYMLGAVIVVYLLILISSILVTAAVWVVYRIDIGRYGKDSWQASASYQEFVETQMILNSVGMFALKFPLRFYRAVRDFIKSFRSNNG